jgi:DNA mismatch repair protein MSH3
MLDCTKTRFGSRLLRHWLTHPLLRLPDVSARHDAVEELAAGGGSISALTELLPSLPDLDRMLLRAQYGRCKPQEVLQMLQAFRKIALAHARALADPPASPLLVNVLRSMPDVGQVAYELLNHLNVAAITKGDNDVPPLLPQFYKGIKNAQEHVAAAKLALDDALPKIRATLGSPGLKYTSVSGVRYLIELENSSAAIKRVPSSWTKINSTKAVSRYHPPEIELLAPKLGAAEESADAACKAAWLEFLRSVGASYAILHAATKALAVLDCLLAFANVSKRCGWMRPKLDHRASIIDAEGLRHPIVENALKASYVPNDFILGRDEQCLAIITGPNMGGKSTFIRSVAIAVVLCQIGCFVPCERATLGMFDSIQVSPPAASHLLANIWAFVFHIAPNPPSSLLSAGAHGR